MKASAIKQLIAGSTELFSLPDIYFQLSEMIRDSRYSLADIGKVIAKDPALSARLLRVVNSPFYGFQAKIDTISRAVTVIGIDDLSNLVLATTVVDRFGKIPDELIDMTSFWMRSIHCAVIARMLAKASAVLHTERLFLAGLLHDIGSLLLSQKMPEQYLRVLLAADHNRLLLAGFEQELIGFTHAEVGGELLKTWGLPESLYETIGCYLSPADAQIHKLDAHLLHMAARLVDSGQQPDGVEIAVAAFSNQSLTLVRLTREQIVSLMEQVEEEFLQMFELLGPNKKFH
ncbi:HDOD domain-containing protein [Methylomonas fluvii]|uniref:HDOD domain-containing protein n=1 Tax=Methylomonas fluvii TaxID=1854564 RepID=A0ABR9DHP9_9GAMM|nr:HDOD domain-containing protein [Methylomonas fluvii]MBD9361417.1 HDOD domain-containing protein [Methylomonas fluvii]